MLQGFRAQWTKVGAAALLAALLSTSAIAADSFVRPEAKAACAALDLHLLWQIEDAAAMPVTAPEDLLATTEAMLAARRLCEEGKVPQAVDSYDKLDLGLSKVRLLQ